jgi:hypothetical protein
MYSFNQQGSPSNPAHVMEWTIVEFKAYIDQFYKIERQINNIDSNKQIILCTKK